MIAAGDPGAPDMPDLTTCYPATAALLKEKGLIAALDEQFTKEELSAYLPRFLEEGRLSDGKLYVFPFAKSTEILFVNQTLFDRFSAATAISLESLSTFEGIADAALRYYEWTDSLIPDDAGFEDKYPDYAPSGHFIKIANGKAYCFGNDEAWYEPGVANHYWCVYDNPEDAD